MGLSSSYIEPVRTISQPLSLLQPAIKECGIKAISHIYNLYTKRSPLTMMEEIKRLNFNFPLISGLNHNQLTTIVKRLILALPDYRYFSNKRYTQNPFTEHHNGIVALKFQGNISTHWIAIIKGKFIDNEITTYCQLQNKYPQFNGFGHTVLYLKPQEAIKLNSLRKEKCGRENCLECYRGKSCSNYKYPKIKIPKRNLDI